MLVINLENGKQRWKQLNKYINENQVDLNDLLVLSDCGSLPYESMPEGCYFEVIEDINIFMHEIFKGFAIGNFGVLDLFKEYKTVVFHNLNMDSPVPYTALENELKNKLGLDIEIIVLCEDKPKQEATLNLIQDPFSEFSQEATKGTKTGFARLSHKAMNGKDQYIFYSDAEIEEIMEDEEKTLQEIIDNMKLKRATCSYLEV